LHRSKLNRDFPFQHTTTTFQELLSEYLVANGHKGNGELGKSLNTDEAAAMGAVYKAADLSTGFKVTFVLIFSFLDNECEMFVANFCISVIFQGDHCLQV
jgi:molecular chaperone DnaK (HSP70)